jgi:subtilisin family serine protease
MKIALVLKLLTRRPSRSWAAALVVALGLGSTEADDGNTPYYLYDGERVPLSVDRTAVLVKDAPSVGDAAASAAESETANTWKRVSLFGEAAESPAEGESFVDSATQADLPRVRAAVEKMALSGELAFVSPIFQPTGGSVMTATPVILAGFKPDQTAETAITSFGKPEITGFEQIGESGIWKLHTSLKDGFAVLELANWIAVHPAVAFAEVDFVVETTSELRPNDPLYPQAWGLSNTGQNSGRAGFDMGAERAWDLTLGSSSVIVLVMDDGTQLDHPDLRVGFGRNFTTSGGNGGPVSSNDKHGTAVAGCVGGRANNGIGATGSAPGVTIASAKISNPDANGSFSLPHSVVVAALDWGRSIGARVSNSSWGGGNPSSTVENAFIAARNAGMIHFAATGNNSAGSIIYPARYDSVVAVGAADRSGNRASFSNYGTGLEFLAPGAAVISTDRTGAAGYVSEDYASVNGTSFASPYAAGVAALLLSREPNLTPAQILERMRQSATDMHTAGYDTVTGYGLINAHRTLVPGASGDDHGNSFTSATRVNFPSQTNGVIETSGDPDFFRFTLAAATDARIASTSTMDPVGELYDGNQNLITSNDDAGAGTNSRDFVISRRLGAGTYYVKITGFDTETGSYRLDLAAAAVASPRMTMEGNGGQPITNGSGSASTANGTQFAAMDRQGSVTAQNYVIRNTGSGTLSLTGTPRIALAGPGSAHFRVSATAGASIATGGSTSLRIEFAPTAAGSHSATVSIPSNDPQANPFTFVIAGTADFGGKVEDDHGNSIWTATPISRYGMVNGNLESPGDEDFFRVQVNGRTVRTRVRGRVRLRQAPESLHVYTTGNIDTYGYLMAGSNTIAYNDDDDEGTNFSIRATLYRGTYYIRVRGYSPDETIGSYTLNIR